MSSDNPIPYVEVRYEWDCFPPDIDTCWVVLVDNKIVRSGP